MPFPTSPLRRAAAAAMLVLAAACGGDSETEMTARPDDVDAKSEAMPTDRERSSFRAPADSVLTPDQVAAYLRTSLLQFDLLRSESKGMHDRLAKIEERDRKGGLIAGLRNVADGVSLATSAADLVGGSYVRSARTLGYNPAELEWVRERMAEVSLYMAMRPMHESVVSQARTLREQAETYRGQEGFDDATIRQMVQSADEMEASARREMEAARAVARNVEVLHRARPEVTDHMWAAVALASGTGGLMALGGLSNPEDAKAQQQLDEWRRIHTDALENRVTPGMERDVPAGEARPRLSANE